MPKLSRRKIFFLGLIAIIIIYSLYNIYFDITNVPGIPGKIKHANKLLFVLIVYGTGTFVLKKFTVQWMMFIWHLIHIVFISVLIIIGLFDWYKGSIPDQIRNIANSLQEFLISPVLYVSMGIIQFRLFRKEKTKDN